MDCKKPNLCLKISIWSTRLVEESLSKVHLLHVDCKRYLMCIFKLLVQGDLFIQNIIIISFNVSLYDVLYRYKISISKTFWISRIKFEQFESVFITCVSIVPIPPPPAPGFLVLLSKQDSVTSGPDSRPRPANWKSQSILRRQTAASYRSVCPYLAWGGRWPDAGTSPARAAAAWATDLLAMFDEENFQAATTLLAKIWGIVIVKHWC